MMTRIATMTGLGLSLRRPRNWLAVMAVMVFLLLLVRPPREAFHHHSGSSSHDGSSPFFGDEEDANFVADAHKLPSADSFLLHFQAVLQQPGISMANARRTCKWAPNATVNFQFNNDVDWVLHDRPAGELEGRRKEWHEFVRAGMIPYSQVSSLFNGRGIVIVAGNHDTIQRVKVVLRAMRRLQSPASIEIHYWREEMNEETRQALEAEWPGVGASDAKLYFNDLSGSHNPVRVKKDQLLINFQLKTAAVLNSRFSEVLLLDSDNIPTLDPDSLWDSGAYREFGTVFWPDIARTRPQNPMWVITNTACRSDEYEQESGQLMVDKRRFWYHLQLAAWWNSAHNQYYSGFILGDKDLFRFAWHALRTRYGRPRRWLASVGTLNEGYYCGHSFAQHHPDDGRVAFLHGGLLKTLSPELIRWNRDEKGGLFRNYKRAPTDDDPSVSVNVAIKFDGADYMPNKTPDFHPAMCTDMFDVRTGGLNELVPFMEDTFREIGGYWQIDGAKAKEKGPSSPKTEGEEASSKEHH